MQGLAGNSLSLQDDDLAKERNRQKAREHQLGLKNQMGEKQQFKRNERVQYQMEQEQMRRNQEEYSRREILREQEYKDKFKKFD